MINTVNALTFRKKFGQLIDQVVKTGNPLVIERQNKPLAVLYPYQKKFGEIEKEEERREKEKACQMLEQWRRRNAKYFKNFDSTKIIRKMRDERYGKRWLKTRTHYWEK